MYIGDKFDAMPMATPPTIRHHTNAEKVCANPVASEDTTNNKAENRAVLPVAGCAAGVAAGFEETILHAAGLIGGAESRDHAVVPSLMPADAGDFIALPVVVGEVDAQLADRVLQQAQGLLVVVALVAGNARFRVGAGTRR
jgi:hypothetical protein